MHEVFRYEVRTSQMDLLYDAMKKDIEKANGGNANEMHDLVHGTWLPTIL